MNQTEKNILSIAPKIIQTGRINHNKLSKHLKFSEVITLSSINKSNQEIYNQRASLERLGMEFHDNDNLELRELNIETWYGLIKVFVMTRMMGELDWTSLRKSLRSIYEKTDTNTNFTDFNYNSKGYYDFWWDIENDIMWSTDKDFMEQFLFYNLKNSFKVMDFSKYEPVDNVFIYSNPHPTSEINITCTGVG